MKAHTNDFKENVKLFGRELDNIITYSIEGVNYELNQEQLNSIIPHYESKILKSVMKQLDIDSNIEIPKGTIINYKFGVKVRNDNTENYRDNYDYVNYGNYIVYSVEKQEDTRSYKIIAYDKMLYTMINYEKMNITYPITIRDFIKTICNHLGLTFKNENDTFVNYDKYIYNELYFDEDGNNLGYTFRDVMDELAQVTASIICINEEDDELEVRYINNTKDTIDEMYLKDINVNFGEQYPPINTLILSRSAGSDKLAISIPEDLEDNKKNAIEIADNQILNFNNRNEFMGEILDKLYGLTYFINDFISTGICYYNVGDKYYIKIGDNVYPCIMFNDEVNVTTGLQEHVYSDSVEGTDTDYSKTDKTDQRMSKTELIVDKQGKAINGLVSDMYSENGLVNENFTRITQNVNEVVVNVQNSGGNNLILNSVMFSHSDDLSEISSWELSGEGTINIQDSAEASLSGGTSGHVFILNNKYAKQRVKVKIDSDDIAEEDKTYYTFSTKIKKNVNGMCYIKISNSNEEYLIKLNQGQDAYYSDYEIKNLLPKDTYYDIEFYGDEQSGATFTDNMFSVGKYKTQWTQANGEIMNSQVSVDVNGMHIKSATIEGTEVIITPFEFSGYAKVSLSKERVFSLNGATTEVHDIKIKTGISMPPIKILSITSGAKSGWHFIKSGGEY